MTKAERIAMLEDQAERLAKLNDSHGRLLDANDVQNVRDNALAIVTIMRCISDVKLEKDDPTTPTRDDLDRVRRYGEQLAR